MKLVKKGILLFILILGTASGLSAQRTLIDVSLDSAAILIGEQTALRLTVTTDRDKAVQIQLPMDMLMRGVEILTVSRPDTSYIENNRMLVKQNVLLTSFDAELYLLPPVRVVDGVDTVYSERLALKVSTIPVNADAPDEFFDIKTVWGPPFVLADYYPFIYGVLLALFLICVIGYILKRLRNRQSLMPVKKAAPKLPPHEQAIRELNEIKQQKLWQQGRSKEYYTQITDTLRKYIVDRFGINAMEMTSAEILDILRKEEDASQVYSNLQQILQLADFVKFAKMHPLPDENDLSLVNAYLFINQTIKQTPVVAAGEETNDEAGTEDSTIIKE
ncbi:MAG: hypothetical protein LIO97_07985 [Tannerellaceae bacterium]|nr:hypothetical protein [Tannerellaceae bacterium]